MEKKPDPGWEKTRSGMNIPDHTSESLETRVKKTFFDADPVSFGKIQIRDLE
jgi:hypothetical protein